jgi:hypothetical protein
VLLFRELAKVQKSGMWHATPIYGKRSFVKQDFQIALSSPSRFRMQLFAYSFVARNSAASAASSGVPQSAHRNHLVYIFVL